MHIGICAKNPESVVISMIHAIGLLVLFVVTPVTLGLLCLKTLFKVIDFFRCAL